MITIDNGYIKSSNEYEELGKNIFPLKYLTEDERVELGLTKKTCCDSSKGCCNRNNKNIIGCDKVKKCCRK